VVEVIKVASSMTIKQSFPEGTTGDSLLADTGYVDSVESGIAAGLGGDYTKDDTTVTSFVLGAAPAADPAPAPAADPAPAPAPAPRRLQGSARRLPEMSLEVNYEIEVKDATAAASIKATLADPAKREAFTNSFVAAYVAAEADKGRTVEGVVVTQSAETTVRTEQRVVPAPAPPPTPAPSGPAPSPGPAPAPAAPAAEEEESEDGSAGIIGGVVGVVAGVGILGGAFYMYKKKQASE